MYQQVHDLIVKYRGQIDFEGENDELEEQMYNEISETVGKVKARMNAAFKLDSLIFAELLVEKFKPGNQM